ncbi:hypothetical protein P0Y35_08645 [Kiritimatiellaeota bacterium B1221]|nr:hypothetical protein [Kiritimatiellaeota bacterium B1221]
MPTAKAKTSVTKVKNGNWSLVPTRDAMNRECFAFSLNGELMMDAHRVMKVTDRELAELILETLKDKKI